MVGSEFNRTRGKRGGIPRDIGASSFPSSFCVASVSGSIFARSLILLSHPSFFFLVNFSPALFNLNAWNKLPRSLHFMAPGSLVSYLWQDPGAYFLLQVHRARVVMIGSCLCLFVFLGFSFILADVYCHILYLRFFVVCSSPIRITLESKQIVPFSLRQSPLSIHITFTTLVIFHVTHHVTALDQ